MNCDGAIAADVDVVAAGSSILKETCAEKVELAVAYRDTPSLLS